MTLPPVRMRLSQKASHSRAGGIAHRSARSQEFAGGARAPEEINARAYVGHALFRDAYKRKKSPTRDDRSGALKFLGFKFLGGWPGHGPYRFYLVSGC